MPSSSPENQRHQLHRQGGRRPEPLRSIGSGRLGRGLNHIGFAQFQGDCLIALRLAELDFDNVHERPPLPAFFVGRESQQFSRRPLRNPECPCATGSSAGVALEDEIPRQRQFREQRGNGVLALDDQGVAGGPNVPAGIERSQNRGRRRPATRRCRRETGRRAAASTANVLRSHRSARPRPARAAGVLGHRSSPNCRRQARAPNGVPVVGGWSAGGEFQSIRRGLQGDTQGSAVVRAGCSSSRAQQANCRKKLKYDAPHTTPCLPVSPPPLRRSRCLPATAQR